jgi:hypothetical protein
MEIERMDAAKRECMEKRLYTPKQQRAVAAEEQRH